MTRYEMIKKLMDGEIDEASRNGIKYRKIDGVVKCESGNSGIWVELSIFTDDGYEEHKEPDEVDKAMEVLVEYCKSNGYCDSCRYVKSRLSNGECAIRNFLEKAENL